MMVRMERWPFVVSPIRTPRRSPVRRGRGVALLPAWAVAALLVAACAEMAHAQAPRTAPDTSRARPNVVTIVAMDYAFKAPATVPAGLTTVRLVNQGKLLHHVQLVTNVALEDPGAE